MSQTFKRPESVLVVIYTVAGEVLLMERQQPSGFWQSVTGSLEWDELPLAAARRELREETGLSPDDGLVDCRQANEFEILPAWRHRYAPETSRNREYVYRLELTVVPEIRLHADEHRRFRWLDKPGALALASSATDRAAIQAFVPEG